MADNPFKRPDEYGFLENDPFAELMRMAEAPRSDAPDPVGESFDIDLERELLGEAEDVPIPIRERMIADHWTREAEPVPEQKSDSVDPAVSPAQPADFMPEGELETEAAFDDLDLSLDFDLSNEEPHLPLSPAEALDRADIAADDGPIADHFDRRSHELFAAVPEYAEEEAEPGAVDFDRAAEASFETFDEQSRIDELPPAGEAGSPRDDDLGAEVHQGPDAPFAGMDDGVVLDEFSFEFDADLQPEAAPVPFAEDGSEHVLAHDADADADGFELDFDLESAVERDLAADAALEAEPEYDPVSVAADPVIEEPVADLEAQADEPNWSALDLQPEGPVEPVAPRLADDLDRLERSWADEPQLRREASDDDDILDDIESWLGVDPVPAPVPAAPAEPRSPHHAAQVVEESGPVTTPPVPEPPMSLEDELGALLAADPSPPRDDAFDHASPVAPNMHAFRQHEDEDIALSSSENDFDLSLELELDDVDSGFLDIADVGYADEAAGGDQDVSPQPHPASVDEPETPKRSGPLAMLAALAPAAIARFGSGSARSAQSPQPAQPLFGMARVDRPVPPEIETVEVDDAPVVLADDLDIPDVPEPEDVAPMFSPDDLEAELDVAFGSLAPDENPPAAAGGEEQQPSQATQEVGEGDLAYGYAQEPYADGLDDDFGDVEFDYEPEAEDYEEPQAAADRRPRRKYFLFGSLAAVALLGGAGFFMMSDLSGTGVPAIVRADPEPFRVRPENRGGTTVPNQDSQAYRRASGATGEPGGGQEQLVTSVEEPMDVRAAVAPSEPLTEFPMVGMEDIPMLDESEAFDSDDTGGMLASVKGDSRLSTVDDVIEDDGLMIAPRRVRTMVVRPDGTLMSRDDLPEPATLGELQPIAVAAEPASSVGENPAPAGQDPRTALEPAPLQGEVLADDPVTPATVNVVPSRPQSQPQASVAQQPVQVAAAAPAQSSAVQSATPVAGEWSMQIASQPTAEGAQSAYQELARRYGSVLEGKGVNIVRADLEGMGTFYRVRIPAATRDEAIRLCESYKSAGGSCFVSR